MKRNILKKINKYFSKTIETEVPDGNLETDREYDNTGVSVYIGQAGYKANEIKERTIGTVVSIDKFACDGWLPEESNEKVGRFSKNFLKEKEQCKKGKLSYQNITSSDYQGFSLDGICIDKNQLHFHGNAQGRKQDSLSTEQLTAIVEKKPEANLKNLFESVEESSNIKRFINFLGLEEYFPDQMQVRHVMTIKRSEKPETSKEIVIMFVKNILMTNFNGRDRFVQENLRRIHKIDTCHSLNDNFSGNQYKGTNHEINPLDLTIAVFICASPMLKHTLASKFFTCQLAVPFAFPKCFDEDIVISTSLLNSVVLECTSRGKSINEVSLDCPCHVVSFFRFGLSSVSKSKLMNDILNDQYHNTFFNSDCHLGSSKRFISEGLIEAAWYLPSSKSSVLSMVTTFLNLRGDAYECQEQLNILSVISSLLVIVSDVNNLNKIIRSRTIQSVLEKDYGIIIAIDAYRNTDNELLEKFEAFTNWTSKYNESISFCVLTVNEKTRSSADVKKELRDKIKMMLDTKPLSPISSRLKSSNLKTNSDIGCYRKVHQTVKDLWELFPESFANVKEQITPIQGEHWTAWSTQQKIVQNSTLLTSQIEAGQIKKRMINERTKQVVLCQNIKPFMKKFIECCWQFSESENEFHVFVILVKQLLDERSRKVLPKSQLQYVFDWKYQMEAKEHKIENAEIDMLLKRVAQSEKGLFEISFGFEHLCREIGQIFEALSECKTVRKDLQKYLEILPKIAATLLLIGHPFELMDGDVANVPLIWIKAVFRELKHLVGDKKLLTLSVLGIQSSGKSTLLNTMFGFQFAVSAGRCTRGVYAQLVPIKSNAFPFDYILVVNTEVLRALELADLKISKDNELATFVVGLGDITIVNIKGGNTTEGKDVLQIVVRAFLRLKIANQRKTSLKKRCIFAYQNIPAHVANDKMKHGRQKTIEILDKMTKEEAILEGIDDIQTFNQVIQLDIEKDIWYFSDLWRGDPPMAPANPGYSETVADALTAITQNPIFKRETYLTITETVTRICDIWTGLLKGDFVFSFRSSLEFKAYSEMERHYQSLTWGLEQKVQEFVKADAKSILMTCDHQDEFDINIPNIFVKLSTLVKDNVQNGTKALDSFIENSCLKDLMIQWQQIRHSKFECFGEELIKQARIDIRNLKTEFKVQKKILTYKTKHEFEIHRLAEEIAVKTKGSCPNEDTIQQAFDKMWNDCINQLATKSLKDACSIKEQIELLIQDRFFADVTYLREVEDSPTLTDIQYNSMKQLEHHFVARCLKTEHYRNNSEYFGKGKAIPIVQCEVQTIEVVNAICRKIDFRLSELQVQDIKFSTAYVSEILNIICEAFDNHNENKKKCFHFNLTAAFRACICSHVKKYLVFFFEKLDEKYNEKHSPKAFMEDYKGTVWKLFKNTVESKTEEVIAVDILRDTLIEEIDNRISGMLPIDVQNYILNMYPFRKFGLIKDILTKLADNADFSDIKSYIQDPFLFSTNWIKDLTNKTMFEDREYGSTVYANLAKYRIVFFFLKIENAISKAKEQCKTENCKTVSQWIDYFVMNINQKNIPISIDTLVHVKSRNVSNLDSFIEILKQQLEDIKANVLTRFEKRRKETVLWDKNPVTEMMLKLWGCTATCMFCKEPCIHASNDHVDLGCHHECLQHRPEGISRNNCVAFCNRVVCTEQTYIWHRGKDDEETRKYREYKKHFPDWDIPPSHERSDYWMWIICKYKDQLTKLYGKEPPDIPENWPLISKDQALKSLTVYMTDD